MILDKVDVRTSNIKRDKGRHHLMIKELFLQKDITILSVYKLNDTIWKYMRQKLKERKREIEKSKILVGWRLHTCFWVFDRKIKVSKDIEYLRNSVNYLDMIRKQKASWDKAQADTWQPPPSSPPLMHGTCVIFFQEPQIYLTV